MATGVLDAPRGLKGLIVAETSVGDVRGEEGFYHYRQYAAPDLAATRTFEDVWWLLFEGELPTPEQRAAFQAEIGVARRLPDELLDLLPAIARASRSPLAGLRTAISHFADLEGLPAMLDVDRPTDPGRRRAHLRGGSGDRRRARTVRARARTGCRGPDARHRRELPVHDRR